MPFIVSLNHSLTSDHRKGLCSREVDNVTGHPGLPAHGDHGLDGGQLHARGPGLQEGRVEAGVRAGVLAVVRKLGLGVKQEDGSSALHSFQSLFDL